MKTIRGEDEDDKRLENDTLRGVAIAARSYFVASIVVVVPVGVLPCAFAALTFAGGSGRSLSRQRPFLPDAAEMDDHLHGLLHVLHRDPFEARVEILFAGE